AARAPVPSAASTRRPIPRTACATARTSDSASSRQPFVYLLRARRQPGGHLRPAVKRRSASGNQRDVAARQLDVLLVATRHGIDARADRLGRRDVVLLRADDEHRARDRRQPRGPSAEHGVTPEELVLLVEVADPLTEKLAGKCDVLVRPAIESVESFDVLVVPQVPPQ